MLADMREEVDAAAYESRKLVDQLEETRRELLELRATEVWVAIYPSATLASEPSTATFSRSQEGIAGAAHAWPRIRPGRFVRVRAASR